MVTLKGCGQFRHLYAWQGLSKKADGYLALKDFPYTRVGDKIILSNYTQDCFTICGGVNPAVAPPNWRYLCKDCLQKAGYIW